MKLLSAIAAAILSAAPAQAQTQTAIQLLYQGHGAMTAAINAVKTTGSMSETCFYLKSAAEAYASLYFLHKSDRTLSLMSRTHALYTKHC